MPKTSSPSRKPLNNLEALHALIAHLEHAMWPAMAPGICLDEEDALRKREEQATLLEESFALKAKEVRQLLEIVKHAMGLSRLVTAGVESQREASSSASPQQLGKLYRQDLDAYLQRMVEAVEQAEEVFAREGGLK